MKYQLFTLTVLLLLIACTRRPQDFVSYSAINNSGAEIKLVTTTSADIYAHYPSDGSIRTLVNRTYGTTTITEANFNTTLTLPSPIKVVFNNDDTVYHYNDILEHSGKYLNKLSDRCLFSFNSYVITKDRGG